MYINKIRKVIKLSTKCLIGYKNENESISFTSCNYNGHLIDVGKILMYHYPTLQKVKKLISGGLIAYLNRDGSPVYYPSSKKDTEQYPCSFVYIFTNDGWKYCRGQYKTSKKLYTLTKNIVNKSS